MASKFRFYEIVRVKSNYKRTNLIGEEGAILGMAEDEGKWSYAVSLYSKGKSYSFNEEDLEPTGKMDKRESFYDGSSVTVKVDPKTSKGRITGYHDPKSN